MTEQDVFILADQALNAVVEQIRDDQWDLVVPDDMTRKPGITLRELINYHAYDDAWVPDVLAGRTIEEVGDKYAGDLLGDHPKLNFASIVETAVLAVRAFDDPDRTVHLSYGDWPARRVHRAHHQLPRPADLRHRQAHRRGHDAAPRSRPGAVGRDRAQRRGVAQAGRVRTGGGGGGGRAAAGPAAGPHQQTARLSGR